MTISLEEQESSEGTDAFVGSCATGSKENSPQKNGGTKEIPLWRRILNKCSGAWLWIDGFGALVMIAAALYIGIVHGVWTLGIGIILFELFGMINSFYAGHHLITS